MKTQKMENIITVLLFFVLITSLYPTQIPSHTPTTSPVNVPVTKLCIYLILRYKVTTK